MNLIRQPVLIVPMEMSLHNFLNEIQIVAYFLRKYSSVIIPEYWKMFKQREHRYGICLICGYM